MALEQKLSLKLSQRLVMTPSLQQAIKLLQMTRLELEGVVAQELEANPVLEVQRCQCASAFAPTSRGVAKRKLTRNCPSTDRSRNAQFWLSGANPGEPVRPLPTI